MSMKGKKIVLGITGSIAAYKAAILPVIPNTIFFPFMLI